MADLCCEYNIASIVINDDTADVDRLMTSFDNGSITGLDGAPVRSQVDPLGQTDGGIVHTKFFGPRIIAFTGDVHIQSVDPADVTAWITAVNTLEAAVISALEGILNTPSNLTWTPTGGSGKSISVTYGVPGEEIQFSGPMRPGARTFSFSLVAALPTISGA